MKKIMSLVFGAAALFALAGSVQAATTVYTTKSLFLSASGAGPFTLNEFNDLNYFGNTVQPLKYTKGGFTYTISSPPDSYAFALPPGMVSSLDNSLTDPYLKLSIPGGVNGVGANFYGTDAGGAFALSRVFLGLSDGTTQTITAGNINNFLGFYTTGPLITSLEIHNPDFRSNGLYPTMDNLYVVPEPSVVMMNLTVLLGVGGAAGYYRRRVSQRG